MGFANVTGLLANIIAVVNGGSNFANLTTSIFSQVKTGQGVFQGLGVNTAGTTSAAAVYDGISATVTLTLASPGVVNWTAHPFVAGQAVAFTTTGALPTGLTAGAKVYVSSASLGANSFKVADTAAHAIAGTNSINFTGSQSGVQTGWDLATPIGTYSTAAQGNLPVGAQFQSGLIISATDGGGAADLTALYI